MLKRVGETNAVSAAYENSIPITAADTLSSSTRVFGLVFVVVPAQVSMEKRIIIDENGLEDGFVHFFCWEIHFKWLYSHTMFFILKCKCLV